MNKQWMALLLSAGMAVTTCPVPGAQEPPAEQIHTEQAEESSAAVHSDDSDREGTAADEFQSETEPSGSETETGAYEEETSENENLNEKVNSDFVNGSSNTVDILKRIARLEKAVFNQSEE